jgi:hypothetical protein
MSVMTALITKPIQQIKGFIGFGGLAVMAIPLALI